MYFLPVLSTFLLVPSEQSVLYMARMWMSFWLGFFEIAIWLIVISTVIHKVYESPILGLFYAFGFATGSMVGICIERRLALGHIILRAMSRKNFDQMAEMIREQGYSVTTFEGKSKYGPVVELYIFCLRLDLDKILKIIKAIEPNAFYVTEQTGSVSKIYNSILQPVTGWRSWLKKK